MIKVSIIVPTHNSSTFMRKCLDSCVNQTMKDIEIIAVDDCSSDDSPKILEEYTNKYTNFRTVYLDKNIRQGGARNVGIRMATGEYIAFVDSDDWIELDMCEKMYKAAHGADMIGSNFYISTNTYDKEQIIPYSGENIGIMNKQKRIYFIQSCGLFPMRIYKRDLLIENNIFFPEGTFYEDAWFNFMTALYAKRIEKTEDFFYHYYQREGSTVHSRNKPQMYERIHIAELIIKDCKRIGIYNKFKDEIDTKFLNMMGSNIIYTCLDGFDTPDKNQLRRIKIIIKNELPDFRKTKSYKNLSTLFKIYLRSNMISSILTIWCYKHNIYEFLNILINKLHSRNKLIKRTL